MDDLAAPFKNNAQSALIVEPKPALNSQKPPIMYSRIKEHWRAPFCLELYARSPQCLVDGLTAVGNQIDAELCTPLPDVPDGTKITPEFLEACRRAKAGLD